MDGQEGRKGACVLNRLLQFLDRHERLFGWPLVLVVSMVSFWLAFKAPGFLEQFEWKLLDARFRLRGPVSPPPKIAIVAIDDASVADLGRWPWPRTTIARLVDTVLDRYQARALAFDIVFSEPQRNPFAEAARLLPPDAPAALRDTLARYVPRGDADARLAATLAHHQDRVVLGYFFYPRGSKPPATVARDLEEELARLKGSAISVKVEGGGRVIGPPEAIAIENNIPKLASSGPVSGFFNFFPDDDGMVRRVPLVFRVGKEVFPNLSLQLLRAGLSWPEVVIETGPEGVEALRVGTRRVQLDPSGKLLLNHYGPAHTFPHVSARDVLAGTADASVLKGAFVFLGATAIGIYDYRPTPFDSAFPGVEGHAAALANMLTGMELLRPRGVVAAEWIGAFVLPLIFGLAALRLGPIGQSLLLVGGPLAFAFLGFELFATQRVWLKLIYWVLGVVLAVLPVLVVRYLIETYRRSFIHDAFSHYLAPAVVEELAEHPELLRLGGEKREMTAMFSDIQGFSSFSERMTPEQLVHFLNMYLGAMSDVILEHEGTIDKYEGDAIVAFFGAPIHQPDHALRAVRAALAQQALLARLREEWAQEGWPAVHARIGINSGEMVVGNMGTERRMNYTIMGDNVNLASRLEGACKLYRVFILMSAQTYQLVRDAIQARFIDRVRVVGRSTPVDLYMPAGERGQVPEEDIKVFRAYERGWALMQKRMFDEAERLFAQLALKHKDPPSEVMLARVRRYKQNPPPRDWDGVYQLEQK